MSGLGMIYITDDEPNIRRLTALALTEYGFDTQEFSSGKELTSTALNCILVMKKQRRFIR